MNNIRKIYKKKEKRNSYLSYDGSNPFSGKKNDGSNRLIYYCSIKSIKINSTF